MSDARNFVHYHWSLKTLPASQVMFVGLSYKLDKQWNILNAFCNSTNSWKIIEKIEKASLGITIHKTNLVKWVPLNNGKIRYPNIQEKTEWLIHLLNEIDIINPKIVYLFGKQVSEFFIKNCILERESDTVYIQWTTTYILVHHPSYIFVYKRKNIDSYVNNITLEIQKTLQNNL